MPWPAVVRSIMNGEPVEAGYTNGPLTDLTQRTDWLKAQLDTIVAGSQILLRNQTVESGVTPGTVVYLDSTTNVFRPALAKIGTGYNTADPESYWQGLVLSVSGTVANIVLGGSMTLSPVAWATVFDSGVFAEGQIFLSGTDAGKITTVPGALGLYLGDMRATGELLVRLGEHNTYLDHVHLQRSLVGKPAGTLVDPSFGGTHVITTPNVAQQGWLPANATYFPGFIVGVQIPTGAKFGYNIQHPSETSLREVFPVIPDTNAQFAQAGSILSSSRIVTNNFGIWWMSDAYGQAPWPTDYGVSGLYTDLDLWTTRLVASSDAVDVIKASIYNSLASGDINQFAVAALKSSSYGDLGISSTDGDAINGYRGVVTLTNNGVTAARAGRGLGMSAPAGNNTTGWKGLIDAEVAIDLPATHLFTYVDGGGSTLDLLTTNGVPIGTSIGLYAHVLGAETTLDYIDFLIRAGSDLLSTKTYQVVLHIAAGVDTVAGTPTSREFNVLFYRFVNGSAASDTNLLRTAQGQINEGTPGVVQQVIVGPYADVLVAQNDLMLVRIMNNTGGNPLTPNTLRVLTVSYGLIEV
jgi:hypothetical protein